MARKKPRPIPEPAQRIPGLVDAHTHLSSCRARTVDELTPLIQRAYAAGVAKLTTVGDDLAECEDAVFAANNFDNVYAAIAIHPTHAGHLDETSKQRLTELAANDKVVAIGETGLDTYWIGKSDECAPLDTQIEALRWHVDLACATGKALMIHNREADDYLLEVLADCPRPREVMLHCFSSPVEVAEQALSRGYVLSFAGNVTFKANDHLREAARIAPTGQLLIETDAPFMTPEPFRGGKNEPAIIGHTALCIAAAKGIDVAELAAEVTTTFDRVFGL